MWHPELKKHRVIRGTDADIVKRQARLQEEDWSEKWAILQEKEAKKHYIERQKSKAKTRTKQASEALDKLEKLLAATLDVDDVIDWEGLKDSSPFPEPKPIANTKPAAPKPVPFPPEPLKTSPSYIPHLTILDHIIPSKRRKKLFEAEHRFEADYASWKAKCEAAQAETRSQKKDHRAHVKRIVRIHAKAIAEWKERQAAYYKQQTEANEAIDRRKAQYEAKLPDAVVEYCNMVLSNSLYPEWMPKEWHLELIEETSTLIIEYSLPSVKDVPTLSEVRYIQTRDTFVDKHLSQSRVKQLYDSVIYKVTLRTIHEIFEADVAGALESVVFNGRVTSIDRSTGHESTACILSVQATRDEFLNINLAEVDSKACFRLLKGVGSSRLHSLTPIAPIVEMRREDGRFVSEREIVKTLDRSVNLAAMDWEDFEHLIRELFEQEFAAGGGEVKVTQASRDEGVDAVVFDPDPIRGGKIVIQAKRYTNTVGVAAIRDLYGTVLNEGANKGILVTTSNYGPDAYSFAKDKPISLMNGANLLHLLEKHGQKAKIDIEEARRLL